MRPVPVFAFLLSLFMFGAKKASCQLQPGHIIVGDTTGLWKANVHSIQGSSAYYDVDHVPGNGAEFLHSSYVFEDHGQFYYVEYLYGGLFPPINHIWIATTPRYAQCFQPGDTIGPHQLIWQDGTNIMDPNGESSCRWFQQPEYYALKWVRSYSPPYDTVYGYEHNGSIYFGMPDSTPLGNLEAIQLKVLTISPNPAVDIVQLRFDFAVGQSARLVVTDLTGRTIVEKDIFAAEQTLDVSGWPEGVYLVGVRTKEGLITRQMVVQRQ